MARSSSSPTAPPNTLDGGGNAWDVFAGLITVVGGVDISPCTIPTASTAQRPPRESHRRGTHWPGFRSPRGRPTRRPPAPGQARSRAVPLHLVSAGVLHDHQHQRRRYSCFAPGLYYIEANSANAAAVPKQRQSRSCTETGSPSLSSEARSSSTERDRCGSSPADFRPLRRDLNLPSTRPICANAIDQRRQRLVDRHDLPSVRPPELQRQRGRRGR